MKRKNRDKRKDKRREEAMKRQEAYDSLTVKEKIAKLDMMFGAGKGAIKERVHLYV